MKTKKIITAVVFFASLVLFSCNRLLDETIEIPKFMKLSLSGATEESIAYQIDLDEEFTHPFQVSYGGTNNYQQGQITVAIDADLTLVDTYNKEHGTSYLPLPESSFSFDKLNAVIENGSHSSDVVQLIVNPALVNFACEYILPVSIKSVDGKIPVNEELKAVYLIIRGNVEILPGRHNWEKKEASSLWSEDYDVENVFDGLPGSYWSSADGAGMPQWFTIDMNGYKLMEGIIWTNGNDYLMTDLPKHVKVETSMDGDHWTEALEIEEVPNVRTMQVMEFPQKVVARYLKVTVLSNWKDSGHTCLADINIWSGERPEEEEEEEYDWEKSTWTVEDFSSQWNFEGAGVHRVFDSNPATGWHSMPVSAGQPNPGPGGSGMFGMPQWFILDMQKTRPPIQGLLIWHRPNANSLAKPKHVIFSVSNDNASWTPILEVTNMSQEIPVNGLDYPTTNHVPGRYLKMEILETHVEGAVFTYLAELTPY